MYDVEAGADGALSEDFCGFGHFGPEHVFFDVVKFVVGKVVEDEVVFETGEDEGFVCLGLELFEGVDAFVLQSLTDLG